MCEPALAGGQRSGLWVGGCVVWCLRIVESGTRAWSGAVAGQALGGRGWGGSEPWRVGSAGALVLTTRRQRSAGLGWCSRRFVHVGDG